LVEKIKIKIKIKIKFLLKSVKKVTIIMKDVLNSRYLIYFRYRETRKEVLLWKIKENQELEKK